MKIVANRDKIISLAGKEGLRTNKDIAEATGLNRNTVNDIVSKGQFRKMSTVEVMASYFNINPLRLLTTKE